MMRNLLRIKRLPVTLSLKSFSYLGIEWFPLLMCHVTLGDLIGNAVLHLFKRILALGCLSQEKWGIWSYALANHFHEGIFTKKFDG